MGVVFEQMGIVYRCVQNSKILPNELKGLKHNGVILIENTISTFGRLFVGLLFYHYCIVYNIV